RDQFAVLQFGEGAMSRDPDISRSISGGANESQCRPGARNQQEPVPPSGHQAFVADQPEIAEFIFAYGDNLFAFPGGRDLHLFESALLEANDFAGFVACPKVAFPIFQQTGYPTALELRVVGRVEMSETDAIESSQAAVSAEPEVAVSSLND